MSIPMENLLSALLIELLAVAGQARLCKMRLWGVFASLRMLALAGAFVLWGQESHGEPCYLVLSYLLLPALFYRGTPFHRLVTACMGGTCIFASYLVGMGFWDISVALGAEGAAGVVVATLSCLAAAAALLGLFRRFIAPFNPDNPDALVVPQTDMMLVSGIPLTQAVLAIYITSRLHPLAGAENLPAGALFVGAAAVVVSNALIAVHVRKRYSEAREAAARLASLQDAFEELSQSYETAMENVSLTAKVRHDFKNQLLTVVALVDRGEIESARKQLESLEAKVGIGGGAGLSDEPKTP